MNKKSDFVVFTYKKSKGYYWMYTKEIGEPYVDNEEEINLTPYLDAEDMLDVLAMLYPEISPRQTQAALVAWKEMPLELKDNIYYFSPNYNEWK